MGRVLLSGNKSLTERGQNFLLVTKCSEEGVVLGFGGETDFRGTLKIHPAVPIR